MIKIYGLHTCPYCDFLQPQIQGKEDQYKYIGPVSRFSTN